MIPGISDSYLRQQRVVSVTLSYNGKEGLANQLKALLSQSRPLDNIIVVDNGSSDGTVDFVRAEYPAVTLISLESNQGVGAGYAVGIIHAVERLGASWIWLFDQDSIPGADALQCLLGAWISSDWKEKLGAVSPVAVNCVTGSPYAAYVWRDRPQRVALEARGPGVQLVDMVITSGFLVRSEAIGTAGLPRSDFFIDFVDFEHCMRIREKGFLIGIVTSCRIDHSIGTPRIVRLLGRRREWSTHAPWRDYYKIRNRTFFVWHQMPTKRAKLFLYHQLLKNLLGAALWDSCKLLRLRLMFAGLRDGQLGRLGSRFAAGVKHG